MADIYLRSSDGSDGDDGSTWALAKATIASAITAAGAGGRIFMSDGHSESAATSISGGTINAPIQILSVDDTADPEPPIALSAGGTLSTSGSADIAVNGYLYFHGVTLTSGDLMTISNVETKLTFDGCAVTSPDRLQIGSSDEDVVVHFKNTSLDLGATSNEILVAYAGRFIWEGGSLLNPPTSVLFDGRRGASVVVRDVDLSTLSSNLIDPSSTSGHFSFLFERCKLHASLSILQNPITGAGAYEVKLQSCDVGDTTYGLIEEYYEGTNIEETTIVRTGGASDGTTSQSIKMVSNANVIEIIQSLVSPPIVHWTDSTSSTTFTVEFIHDSVTALQDDEVWLELEYPGADAQGDRATSKVDLLATPADTTSSAETWTTTGLTNPNERKLAVTVTPGKVGPVTARVYLSKPCTTIYVDPVITES